MKSYTKLNLLRASTFNFERLDVLRDWIRHLSKKLLSFEFAESFNIQFRASRCITGLNRTSEKILSLFEFLGVSGLNFECLDILRDSFRHPSKKILSLEFSTSLCFQFWASRYVIGLNRTSEWKFIIVRIFYDNNFSLGSPIESRNISRRSKFKTEARSKF